MGLFSWIKKAIRFIGQPLVRGFDWVRDRVGSVINSVGNYARNNLHLGPVLDYIRDTKIPVPGVGEYSVGDLVGAGVNSITNVRDFLDDPSLRTAGNIWAPHGGDILSKILPDSIVGTPSNTSSEQSKIKLPEGIRQTINPKSISTTITEIPKTIIGITDSVTDKIGGASDRIGQIIGDRTEKELGTVFRELGRGSARGNTY